MRIFITFGQTHTHRINGKTFDCDCVGVVNCDSYKEGRDWVYGITNGEFCFSYTEDEFKAKPDMMQYFPRGLMEMN